MVEKLKQLIHHWIWIVLIFFLGVGTFYPVIGALALICMLAPVAGAFFQGRSWCGSFCPRGSFNDILLSKVSFKGKTPTLFRQLWFRITFLALLMSAFTVQIIWAWGKPVAIGAVFMRMIMTTTIITIVLGLIYQPRTWCQFCPMGTIAHLITKWRSHSKKLNLVTFKENACIDCKVCTKSCPVNIDVHRYKEAGRVDHPDCLKCSVCVSKCPKKALSIKSAE
jgi:ferredoxin-type protein NapH